MSFIDKAKDVADDVKDKTVDLVDKIGEKIPDSVKDTAGDFKDKAGDLVDKVKERLGFGDDKSDAEDAVADAADADEGRRRRCGRCGEGRRLRRGRRSQGRRLRQVAGAGQAGSRRGARGTCPSLRRGRPRRRASRAGPAQRTAPGVSLSLAISPCIGVPSTSTMVPRAR